jgi:hypothetical protein
MAPLITMRWPAIFPPLYWLESKTRSKKAKSIIAKSLLITHISFSMTTKLKDLINLKAAIDSKKVGEIVIDALQEIMPHVRSASTADIMMA